MRGMRSGLVLFVLAVCLLVSARLTLRAQEREKGEQVQRKGPRPEARQQREAMRIEPGPPAATVSVQDALQRPFSFPFAEPTSLAEVGEYLRRTLKAPVVLDLAALDRQEVKPEDPVQLHLEGVRLKTGLKLLLDQVGLTFQVIPEDNLLVLTDTEGSTDPFDHVLTEIKALHRHVHDLQDAVDDILWALGFDAEEGGAKMRKPTIIEEVPGENKPAETPQPPPQGESDRPRTRPGA